MIAQILSVRSMSINDSDVQKRDCERKRLRGKVIKRETAAGGGGEEREEERGLSECLAPR